MLKKREFLNNLYASSQNQRLKLFAIIIILLTIGFSGCTNSNENQSRKWQTTETLSGMIYNGTVSIAIFYPVGQDDKKFIFPEIKPDNEYHFIRNMKIINTGTLWTEIIFSYDGELSLAKYDTKGDMIQQLSVGENSDINNISLKFFIKENSTENKNYIIFSPQQKEMNFYLIKSLAPGDEIDLYFYAKSHNSLISGTYESLFQIHLTTLPSTGPVFNPQFELFDIKNNEIYFYLDFTLILSSDISLGDIEITYPSCSACPPLYLTPFVSNKSNYHITLNMKVEGNSRDYPFDSYHGTIALNAINQNNTQYINDSLRNYGFSRTTTEWRLTAFTDGNNIIFNFDRIQEINVFWFIFCINMMFIIAGFVIIILYYTKKILKDDVRVMTFLPWISVIFFGLDYITFYSPEIFSRGSKILGLMCIILFIMQLFNYLDKRKKRRIFYLILILTLSLGLFLTFMI